jgi:phosphoribosylformylglycinamidine (FGAM) synthase PurS component
MKALRTVMLKTTDLDPQGKIIHGALKKMGNKGVGRCAKANSLN